MHNWNIEKDLFSKAVSESFSIAQVIKKLNLTVGGANYKMVKTNVKKLNLDISHWLGQGHYKGKTSFHSPNKIPIEKILVKNSTYTNSNNLKKRLFEENLLKKNCSICKCEPIWNDKPLTLQLDHINGINDDNRIENLRLLCPNCHSQTDTFAGRKLKKPNNFCECGTKIKRNSKSCGPCRIKI